MTVSELIKELEKLNRPNDEVWICPNGEPMQADISSVYRNAIAVIIETD